MRRREKHALIMRVMESMRKKKEEKEVKDSVVVESLSVPSEVDNAPKMVNSIFATTDIVSLFYDHHFLTSKDILSEIDKDFVCDSMSVNPLFTSTPAQDINAMSECILAL